jgi:subtilisin family serine protease
MRALPALLAVGLLLAAVAQIGAPAPAGAAPNVAGTAVAQGDPFGGRTPDDFDLSAQRPAKGRHAKLDSQLNRLAAQVGRRALPAIAGEAPLADSGSVAVTIRLSGAAAGLDVWLAARGAVVANTGAGVIEAYVPVDQLAALGARPEVVSARALVPAQPAVTSQGAGVHGSPSWNTSGYSGAGVKVGILDGGFEGYPELMGSELPGTVVARCYVAIGQFTGNVADCENGEVHGTGVAETVADVAPGASFYIANPISALDLQASAQWLVSQGVTVINHSVGWTWDGPGNGTSNYSESPLRTVDSAVSQGATWVNAAGNEGLSTWFGPYADANANDLIEFAPEQDANVGAGIPGGEVMLQVRWEDAWGAAARDLDVLVIDEDGNLLAAGVDLQDGGAGQDPYELVTFNAPASGIYGFGLVHAGGGAPGWIQVQEVHGYPLYTITAGYAVTSPAESANPGLLAAGAANWSTPGTIEEYSSQGPTPDGRAKPDIVGVDCADSVSYGSGDSAFCGTSQAAPHVAGLAALVKGRFPAYTPAEVAGYLKANATPTGAGQPNTTWGYGLAHLPEVGGPDPTPTPPPAGDAFTRTWQRTDQPVADGAVSRTWMWGPAPFSATLPEAYDESPGGQRDVIYYDKSRMEITNPSGDQNSIWYVTNGLLARELISGQRQVGNARFETHAPAQVNVAGDPDDTAGPTYATFGALLGAAPLADGATIIQRVARDGSAGDDPALARYGVTAAWHVQEPGLDHQVASPFWAFMNSSGLVYENGGYTTDGLFENAFYATGLPITEAYWTTVKVGGQQRDVLVQCFERRCLTYTPANDPTWQVEAGNVGQHYYIWRYGAMP